MNLRPTAPETNALPHDQLADSFFCNLKIPFLQVLTPDLILLSVAIGGSGDAALNAVRAFMLFGLFAQIGAAIICLMVALEKTDKWLIASILFFASGNDRISKGSVVNWPTISGPNPKI